LISRVVVDVDCDATECGYFGSELVKPGVVLPGIEWALAWTGLPSDAMMVGSWEKGWLPFTLVGL